MGKKTKKQGKIISTLIILMIALILGAFTQAEIPTKVAEQKDTNTIVQSEVTDDLKVYFIDVGQADSILITSKDETMLIDAGNNEDGVDVVNFIKEKGITKLNYVIGTHPHEDHIGGLDDVINAFDIENVYLPDITTNTKTFEEVLNAIENKHLEITTPQIGDTFAVGESNCKIKSTIVDESNLNLASLVVRLEFGKNSFLFMGDAENENEEQTTWEQTTVLKVGHHGSNTSSSLKFLEQVKPQIAVIMVGEGNSYGHPNEETLEKLQGINAKIYRTDENGTITITSNGTECKVETEK